MQNVKHTNFMYFIYDKFRYLFYYKHTYINKMKYEAIATVNKAKQINILGSRQHLAENVRCGAIFLARVESRYMHLMVYDQYKFHLSIVCDM